MKLWYLDKNVKNKDKWLTKSLGLLSELNKPIDQIINDCLRQEELGKIHRPYFLVLEKTDIMLINTNPIIRAFLSSNTNRPFLMLLAASEQARILYDNAPMPGEVEDVSDPNSATQWALMFKNENSIIEEE